MREHTPAVFAADVQRWEAADGSGRQVSVENPPDYGLTAAAPLYRTSDAEFAAGRTTISRYPAGHQRSPIIAPLATQPARLATQLNAVDPTPGGAEATIRAVDELYTSHYAAGQRGPPNTPAGATPEVSSAARDVGAVGSVAGRRQGVARRVDPLP